MFSRFNFFKTAVMSIIFVSLILPGTMVFAGGAEEDVDYMTIPGKHKDVWKLEATDGLLIGGYGNNFSYDGKRVQPIGGKAVVNVNAEKNTGMIEVVFNGTVEPEAGKTFTGEIKLIYDKFAEGSDFWEGGLADFVYLHGDTGQEAPVMPKVKTDLASWGPVDLFVDGKLIYDDLAGHMMYTEGTRDSESYVLYNADKSGFYSPKNPSDGSIAHPDRKEIHFVAHTTDPDAGNFPPHTVWIHLNFQTVVEK